jgi:hypothetical protein
MKKKRLIGFAVLAALAISVVSAASAFGAGEWLLNGAPVAKATAGEAPGTILLEDTAVGIGPLICHLIYVVRFGPGNADEVIEVLKSDGTAPPISCEDTACAGKLVEITPVGLPWPTQIILTGTIEWDKYFPKAGKLIGFSYTCTVLGIKVTDECTGTMGAKLINVTGGVEGIFVKETEINPNLTCTFSKEKTGTIEGGNVTKPGSGTLTAS